MTAEKAGHPKKPLPGSDEAVALGCTCPVEDNQCGDGLVDEGGGWLVVTDCPLHGDEPTPAQPSVPAPSPDRAARVLPRPRDAAVQSEDTGDEAGVRYFGEKWDAPLTDDAVQIDTPADLICMTCREGFRPDDQGVIHPSGFAQHKECSLRSVLGGIGHHVDHDRYCSGELGPDAGLGVRQSSILVWGLYHGARYTVQDLERMRTSGT